MVRCLVRVDLHFLSTVVGCGNLLFKISTWFFLESVVKMRYANRVQPHWLFLIVLVDALNLYSGELALS